MPPGKLVVEDPLPPVARVNGIQCSTAHITAEDNALLFTLSHQHEDLASLNGLVIPAQAICSIWGRGRFRSYASNVWVRQNPAAS